MLKHSQYKNNATQLKNFLGLKFPLFFLHREACWTTNFEEVSWLNSDNGHPCPCPGWTLTAHIYIFHALQSKAYFCVAHYMHKLTLSCETVEFLLLWIFLAFLLTTESWMLTTVTNGVTADDELLVLELQNKALESWILRPLSGWRYCFHGHSREIKDSVPQEEKHSD